MLVDYWFTYCPPCRRKSQRQTALSLYHDRGFDVVGVSVDDSHIDARNVHQDEQIPWVNLFDTGTARTNIRWPSTTA